MNVFMIGSVWQVSLQYLHLRDEFGVQRGHRNSDPGEESRIQHCTPCSSSRVLMALHSHYLLPAIPLLTERFAVFIFVLPVTRNMEDTQWIFVQERMMEPVLHAGSCTVLFTHITLDLPS